METIVFNQGARFSTKFINIFIIFLFFFHIAVVLADSVLAFHRHGMQGRSFKNNEVTQEICDRSRIFKLLGSDR